LSFFEADLGAFQTFKHASLTDGLLGVFGPKFAVFCEGQVVVGIDLLE
jgi:hypothetical protein